MTHKAFPIGKAFTIAEWMDMNADSSYLSGYQDAMNGIDRVYGLTIPKLYDMGYNDGLGSLALASSDVQTVTK